nr:MAG TPA: Arc-like DNA binding domain protein [Caudoviricetes sp.]
MIIVEVEATVTYTCYLSEKESKEVKSYAKKNDLTLREAVEELYGQYKIDLYKQSTESDFSTESFNDAYEYVFNAVGVVSLCDREM